MQASGSTVRMATFAPSSHPPMLCEHNHGVINGTSDDMIDNVCGESFETDEDGLPSFEDCLGANTNGVNNVSNTEFVKKTFLHHTTKFAIFIFVPPFNIFHIYILFLSITKHSMNKTVMVMNSTF